MRWSLQSRNCSARHGIAASMRMPLQKPRPADYYGMQVLDAAGRPLNATFSAEPDLNRSGGLRFGY